MTQWVKNLPAMQEMQETQVRSLGQGDLEEGLATHSTILAWRVPGRLQSTGLQRVGHKVIEHTRTHAIQLGKKNPEKNKELIYATMWMNIMLSGKKHLENILS